MTSEIKNVYRETSYASWEKWAPGNADLHSQETSDSMKFALIVRRELRQGDTGAPILALHSIVIQSRLIKAQLHPVFAGYPGINMNLRKIEFSSPFHEFFYRWAVFVKARPHDEESAEYKHYMLFFDIVQMEVTPHINQTEDLLVNGSITFNYLWAIFEPSSEIYSRVDGSDRIFHLMNSYWFIDTDGDHFGFQSTSLVIDQFGQVKPISELSVIPLHQKTGIDEIRRELEQRGRKFEALAGCHYRSYTGSCVLMCFHVDGVTDVETNDAALGHLVLPSDYKRVIWAFVEAQLAGSEDFDDVIKGKGKGMIMLLAGEPGTGKTLTSESVAESLRRPLYSMTAGELGNTAGEVDEMLQRVLELSSGWGAVLLIDECDVFLECRSSKNLHRNQLVSVFLRLLEYHQGVMFLITNRADSFDQAFESRIHLTIQYPHLDAESRLHIWKTFEQLNGRQVKNVIKTARLLAASDGTALSPEHVETVLRIKHSNATFT
ncbi:P-loop containing nucleoside triphosphate hydrolase protein [Colletotrichum zoysiae]|uniref:P-loop containing nucleoside triphosphate hydrolase protein n=1 Tax=Colletotrichum zoysiae TaxID=1216348 RepID=A0AAD9HKY3_9PEZI|nr:P-loop containing nucleoside triphosphate hydrolase protein [Colletotrichum zoysiae]